MVKKIFDVSIPTYTEYVMPVVEIPSNISKILSDDEKKTLADACLKDYREAKESLNESIADVAVHDGAALSFAFELSQRVLTIMEIAADLGLDKRVSMTTTDDDTLMKLGVSKEAIEARSEGFLQELKRGALKREIVSHNAEHDAGYVGMSPLAIQNASSGNLRESMYICYKSVWGFTHSLFAKESNVEQINKAIKSRGYAWQINKDVLAELLSLSGGHSVYQYGAYAQSREGSRVGRDRAHQKKYQTQNPTVSAMKKARIPLSERELLSQTGDLEANSSKQVTWLPGEAYFGVHDDPALHPSLQEAQNTGEVMLTGISGATDSILTMSLLLGVAEGDEAEEKMRDGLVACMGWMIDGKDHSAHEILTSAKSFGLAYTPGPESYKQIRPGDVSFEESLRAAQHARGHDMPDETLDESHVYKKALEIFPDIKERQGAAMRTTLADIRAEEIQEDPDTLMKKNHN